MSEKLFSGLTLVWSELSFVLGPTCLKKNFDPVGQYFPLRKCDGSSDPLSRYMKIFYIAARGSGLPSHFHNYKGKYWPTGSKFFWGILAPKRMITPTRLKSGPKKVFWHTLVYTLKNQGLAISNEQTYQSTDNWLGIQTDHAIYGSSFSLVYTNPPNHPSTQRWPPSHELTSSWKQPESVNYSIPSEDPKFEFRCTHPRTKIWTSTMHFPCTLTLLSESVGVSGCFIDRPLAKVSVPDKQNNCTYGHVAGSRSKVR